jgi:hypothetical protein
MKKIFLLALACIMMLGAQAQIVSSRSVTIKKAERTTTNYVRFGVGFMNLSLHGPSFYFDDEVGNTSSKAGYNFVYGFQKPITDFNLYWDFNVGLGSRGFKYKEEEDGYIYKENFIAHNVQLSPINIGCKPSITDNIKIDIHAGVYASFDYAGKGKWEETGAHEVYDSESYSLSDLIDDLDEDVSYRRYDVGLNVGVGVWYDRFNIDLTYQTGFIDAIHDSEYNAGAKSHNLLLRLGIAF